jgi:UDP-GlcNAc:undecaprenyl-phosphate GlcNAc-1-phosphate transferase
MSFPLNIYALSFLGAALVTALTLPLWRAWSRRISLIDDPGHRKLHHTPVPLAGGLAVLAGILVPLSAAVLGLWLIHSAGHQSPVASLIEPFTLDLYRYGLNRRTLQLLVLLLGAIGMVALGLWDDKHELRPLAKFSGQFLIAAAVAASGIRITLFVDNALFSYAVTILWIVALTNATNFMDNMNGLCAGLGLIGSWAFAWTAASHGQYLVAAVGFLAAGALLGFLPFNFPRASVFLGDSGSHLVGYLLALLAILPHFHTAANVQSFAVFKPLLILGVILADLVSVVYIRWRLGQPFYVGDQNHFSHRLVRSGRSPTLAVLLLWLAAAFLAALAFL